MLIMRTAYLVAIMLLLAGCAQQALPAPPGQQTAPGRMMQQMPPADMHDGVKDIYVEAYQFGYDPNEIRLKTGDHVRFHVSTRDVGHGFRIPELNINIGALPGKPGVQEFTATAPGTYSWFCNIPCGKGHKDMKGMLIIDP